MKRTHTCSNTSQKNEPTSSGIYIQKGGFFQSRGYHILFLPVKAIMISDFQSLHHHEVSVQWFDSLLFLFVVSIAQRSVVSCLPMIPFRLRQHLLVLVVLYIVHRSL